jgi:uncharacterized membrane protein (DUF373 family)
MTDEPKLHVDHASRLINQAMPVVLRVYDRFVDVIIMGSVLLMLIALLFSFFDVLEITSRIAIHLSPLSVDEKPFRDLVVNVLDIFVVIELFSTFTGYARTRHIKLSPLLDVTIVFALREILVKLYANTFAINDLIGLCVIVIILVMARSLSVHFSPLNRHGPAKGESGKKPELPKNPD